ncbi:MAG: hypothetical protein Q4G69_10465 [Planctomycetia bacterium]|nr:hypothetical protein [Planctomycetia bacterium]
MKKFQLGWTLGLAFFFTILIVAGCGPKGPVTGDVTGSAAWKGKPLESGIVTLYSPASGKGASAELGAGGSFTMRNVEAGSYQVSIAPPTPVIPGPDGTPPKPQARFVLPAKFQEGQTSGLTIEVKPDTTNTLTLDLK